MSAARALLLLSALGSAAAFDPYQQLGLEYGALPKEIKKAYGNMAMINHPDKCNKLPPRAEHVCTQQMVQINAAWEQLKPCKTKGRCAKNSWKIGPNGKSQRYTPSQIKRKTQEPPGMTKLTSSADPQLQAEVKRQKEELKLLLASGAERDAELATMKKQHEQAADEAAAAMKERKKAMDEAAAAHKKAKAAEEDAQQAKEAASAAERAASARSFGTAPVLDITATAPGVYAANGVSLIKPKHPKRCCDAEGQGVMAQMQHLLILVCKPTASAKTNPKKCFTDLTQTPSGTRTVIFTGPKARLLAAGFDAKRGAK